MISLRMPHSFGGKLELLSLLQTACDARKQSTVVEWDAYHLHAQMPRSMLHMVVCKGSNEVVAVVVVGLKPYVNALVVPRLLGRLDEVLGEQLLLLVEIIAGALLRVNEQS